MLLIAGQKEAPLNLRRADGVLCRIDLQTSPAAAKNRQLYTCMTLQTGHLVCSSDLGQPILLI